MAYEVVANVAAQGLFFRCEGFPCWHYTYPAFFSFGGSTFGRLETMHRIDEVDITVHLQR